MLANGLIELTIWNSEKLDDTKSGCISGTEMATLSSRTETAASCIDLDRREMLAYGLIELTIRILRNWRL